MSLVGKIFTLPSGNAVRVTGFRQEDVQQINDQLGTNKVVTAVYEHATDQRMKTIAIRLDWFERYALEVSQSRAIEGGDMAH